MEDFLVNSRPAPNECRFPLLKSRTFIMDQKTYTTHINVYCGLMVCLFGLGDSKYLSLEAISGIRYLNQHSIPLKLKNMAACPMIRNPHVKNRRNVIDLRYQLMLKLICEKQPHALVVLLVGNMYNMLSRLVQRVLSTINAHPRSRRCSELF